MDDEQVQSIIEQWRNTPNEGRASEQLVEISFKAGIREVVEWIRTQQLPKEYQAEEYRGLVVIANKFWQAKLKDWGIKDAIT